jgi:alanyl-tRNA synthetase
VNGFSRELCGGTHVRNTGQIGIIKIASESSIAAGIRRIEAITGTKALQRFRQSEEFLDLLCQQLKTSREELLPTLERSESSLKELQKKNLELQSKLARQLLGDILAKSRKIGGVEVVAAHVENLAQKALRELADNLRNQLQTGIVILGTSQEGKASLVVMVSPGLLNKITAVQIVKEIAPIIAGGGGGKPELAEAGGKKPEMLGQALEDSHGVVARLLSRT